MSIKSIDFVYISWLDDHKHEDLRWSNIETPDTSSKIHFPFTCPHCNHVSEVVLGLSLEKIVPVDTATAGDSIGQAAFAKVLFPELCLALGVHPDAIRGTHQIRWLSRVRWIISAVFLHFDYTLTEVAGILCKHHSSLVVGRRSLQRLIDQEPYYQDVVDQLTEYAENRKAGRPVNIPSFVQLSGIY